MANTVTPAGTNNFSSKQAGFAIYFPGEVKQTSVTKDSPVGKTSVSTFASQTGKMSYVVIVIPQPKGVDTADTTKFLDGVQGGFIQSSHSTLTSSRDVTLGSGNAATPGREISATLIAGGNKGQSRGFFYVTPRFCYQVLAIGLQDEFLKHSAQTDKVLRSFRLLPASA